MPRRDNSEKRFRVEAEAPRRHRETSHALLLRKKALTETAGGGRVTWLTSAWFVATTRQLRARRLLGPTCCSGRSASRRSSATVQHARRQRNRSRQHRKGAIRQREKRAHTLAPMCDM